MATNYGGKKTDLTTALHSSSLPTSVVDTILKSLGKTVILSDMTESAADVKGVNLPGLHDVTDLDLSGITNKEVAKAKAFIFDSSDDVTFDLGSSADTVKFKGVVTTNEGDDTINVFGKKATIYSGDGNDTVTTGNGKDNVILGAGDDEANTGGGNDKISTGLGNDSVDSGSGNDTVYVGSGNDTVNTGDGKDIVKLAASFTGDAVIDGGADKDTLNLSKVVITDVHEMGGGLHITLDDGSSVMASNFEKFIFDTSTVDTDGKIVTVGINDFMTHDFGYDLNNGS